MTAAGGPVRQCLRVFFLSGLLLAAACAPRPTLPPPPPAPAAETLLGRLDELGQAFRSLEGIAKVRVTQEGKTIAATQVLFAEKPDRLRAETLSPFGQPLLLLASDGAELTVLVPGEGAFYRGEASARNLQRFTRVPLRLTDLVHILLYQVPVIPHSDHAVAVTATGEFLLSLRGEGEARQELLFDRELRLLGASYTRDGEVLLRVGYDRFTGEVRPFPTGISLEMPGHGAAASLSFSEVRTNMALPEGRFLLSPPPGVEARPIP